VCDDDDIILMIMILMIVCVFTVVTIAHCLFGIRYILYSFDVMRDMMINDE